MLEYIELKDVPSKKEISVRRVIKTIRVRFYSKINGERDEILKNQFEQEIIRLRTNECGGCKVREISQCSALQKIERLTFKPILPKKYGSDIMLGGRYVASIIIRMFKGKEGYCNVIHNPLSRLPRRSYKFPSV